MNNNYSAYLCRNPEHEFSDFFRRLLGMNVRDAKALLKDSEESKNTYQFRGHFVDDVCVYVEFTDKETGKKFNVGDFDKTLKAKNGQ